MYEHLQQLHECQLWSSLAQVGPLVLTMHHNQSRNAFLDPNQTPSNVNHGVGGSAAVGGGSEGSVPVDETRPTSLLTPRQRLHTLTMVGDAHFEMGDYKRAEIAYKEVLQAKKQLGKSGKMTAPVNGQPVNSGRAEEDETNGLHPMVQDGGSLKYKLHLCYIKTQQPTQAINILQSIHAKHRTPQSNMALGRLYQRAGMERPAIACFKEVLKACPLALDAAQILMSAGVKAKEIQELTLDGVNKTAGCEWFSQWSQAQSQFASKDFSGASQAFRLLEERTLLRNEPNLLVHLGRSQYFEGDMTSAGLTLQRVHRFDPNQMAGMDILAAILYKERKAKELEQLATQLMSVSEEAPESWIAMGYYCFLNKKGSRAVYFAHRACMINNRCVEALILKGNVLLELRKLPDAMNHFREAMLIAPSRFEIHQGLVDCYLAQSRHREAVSVAAGACKQMPQPSPRALTLFASVLLKDPYQLATPRAKSFLERALELDSSYLPAAYMLADILDQELQTDKAIELLQKVARRKSTSKLHQILGDLLVKAHEEEKALEHFTLGKDMSPIASS